MSVSQEGAPQERATFYDGASGRRRDVTLRFEGRLSIREGDTELANWSYPSIRVADAPPDRRRFRSLEAPDLARLEIAEGALADQLIAASPSLHRGTVTIATERIVLWSIGAAISIFFVIFIGVPYAADRLAPLVPLWLEKRIGDVVEGQVGAIFGRRVCTEQEGRAALDKMLGELGGAAGLPLPEASVIASPIPNAVALPGGKIFLFQGLLRNAQSPDEIAGVLAHEIGHVMHRDGMRKMIESGGTSFFIGLLFGDVTGSGAALFAARQLLEASYSRDAERNADAFAIATMRRLGRSPAPMGELLLRVTGDERNRALSILATHPLTGERLETLKQATGPANGAPLLSVQEWDKLRAICGG